MARRAAAAVAAFLVAVVFAGCAAPAPDVAPSPVVEDGPWATRFGGSLESPAAVPTNASWGTQLTGFAGAEPTLGITAAGTLLMVSNTDTIRSTDGGANWTVSLDFRNDTALADRVTSDPYLWVDATTDRAFTMHMVGLYCTYIAYSDDDGETWTGRDGQCGTPVLDHPKLGSAPAPAGNPAAGVAFPSVLYQCFNTPGVFGFVFRCAMSYDGGDTFPVTTSPFNAVEGSCSGLGGVTAGRADGVAAIAGGYRCSTGHSLAITADGGLTWQTASGPANGAQSMDPDITFGPDGALWLAWRGDDERVHLARSMDLAQTWDGPWDITPPGLGSTAFEAVAVRDDGSVAVAYLGTNATGPPGEVGGDANWHLYAATWSPAAGQPGAAGFTSYRLGDDPAHVGGICYVNRPCEDGGRNLLEFIDAQVAPDGTFFVAYSESCVAVCDEEPTVQSADVRRSAIGWLVDW